MRIDKVERITAHNCDKTNMESIHIKFNNMNSWCEILQIQNLPN